MFHAKVEIFVPGGTNISGVQILRDSALLSSRQAIRLQDSIKVNIHTYSLVPRLKCPPQLIKVDDEDEMDDDSVEVTPDRCTVRTQIKISPILLNG